MCSCTSSGPGGTPWEHYLHAALNAGCKQQVVRFLEQKADTIMQLKPEDVAGMLRVLKLKGGGISLSEPPVFEAWFHRWVAVLQTTVERKVAATLAALAHLLSCWRP